MKGLTLMSWLRMLNRVYRNSRYARPSRCVYVHESDCEVNFKAMHRDAIILDFEQMVEDSERTPGGATKTKKCDLVAVHGNESHLLVVLVEVKGGKTKRERAITQDFDKAREQLVASVLIVKNEVKHCEAIEPPRIIGHAVVVVRGVRQETVVRNVLSSVNADFRRETGFRLSIALCGDDIGQRIGAGQS